MKRADEERQKLGVSEEEFNFLAKPVTPSGLLKKVRSILDNA